MGKAVTCVHVLWGWRLVGMQVGRQTAVPCLPWRQMLPLGWLPVLQLLVWQTCLLKHPSSR